MQLNGWIRLWIVLSVSWFVLIGCIAYDDLSTLYTKKERSSSKETIGSVRFIFSAKQSDYDIQEYFNKELIPLIEKNPQNYVGKTDDTPYKKYIEENVMSTSIEFIKVTLFPIFGLFVFGWSCAWVRKGFLKKPETINTE